MAERIAESLLSMKNTITVPRFVRERIGATDCCRIVFCIEAGRIYIAAESRGANGRWKEPDGGHSVRSYPVTEPMPKEVEGPPPPPAPVLGHPSPLAGHTSAAVHGTGPAVPASLPAKPRTKLAAARAEFDALMSEYDAGDCGARARGIAFKREQMEDRNLGTDAADWVVYPRQTRDGCASKDFCDRDHREQASASV